MKTGCSGEFVLSLVDNAIHGVDKLEWDCSAVDWEEIYKVARRNQLIPLLYEPVKKLAGDSETYEKLLSGWKNSAIHGMLTEHEKYRTLQRLLKRAEELDVTCVVFKGCVLADLYPEYLSRVSCDTDIFVYERDREKAIMLFEEQGYRKDDHSSKDQVYVYVLDKNRYVVELHFSLWEDYKGTKIDLINGMQLVEESTLIRLKACGLEVTTLGYKEHLIYQMFHIIKHFSLQGISIRYLIDVTLYINRNESKIDFADFWSKMETLSYDKFCENFFYLCTKYLQLSPNILSGRDMKVTADLQKLMTDLIDVGTIYEDKNAGWQILGIMTPYFIGEQEIPKSRLVRRIKILFPPSRALPEEYAYARKYKLLLPIAWVHKSVYFLIKRHRNKKNWYDAKEKLIVAEYRLSLMRDLGLVEGGHESC